MKTKEYPGKECGLSQDEWQLEQVVDDIKATTTIQGIGILMRLRETYAQQAGEGLREALEKIRQMTKNSTFSKDSAITIIAIAALSGKQETENNL